MAEVLTDVRWGHAWHGCTAVAIAGTLGERVAADAEVEDGLVGPVDELGGRDARAAHQVDEVGVGQRLDVVDALLGEPRAVVEVDALELSQRCRLVERQLLPPPCDCDSFSRSHTSALCGMNPTKNISTSAAGPL